MGAVRDYIRGNYGCAIETVERTVTLTAGVKTQIVKNNPDRFGLIILNTGTGLAYTGFSSDGVGSGAGMLIGASGGRVGYLAKDDGELTTREQYGFSTAGTTLFIVETVKVLG